MYILKAYSRWRWNESRGLFSDNGKECPILHGFCKKHVAFCTTRVFYREGSQSWRPLNRGARADFFAQEISRLWTSVCRSIPRVALPRDLVLA